MQVRFVDPSLDEWMDVGLEWLLNVIESAGSMDDLRALRCLQVEGAELLRIEAPKIGRWCIVEASGNDVTTVLVTRVGVSNQMTGADHG